MNLVKYTRIFLRVCDRMFKTKNIGTSLDKNKSEVLREYTDCNSVNVHVCHPVHHELCNDVPERISKLVPRQKYYCKSREDCHQVPNEVYNKCTQVTKETKNGICEDVELGGNEEV